MKATKQVVAYARVSSCGQNDHGHSIGAQLEILRTYAAQNGLQIVGEFAEVASANSPERKELRSMGEFLRKPGSPRTILVVDEARLSRSLNCWALLADLDPQIHFVQAGSGAGECVELQFSLILEFFLTKGKYFGAAAD